MEIDEIPVYWLFIDRAKSFYCGGFNGKSPAHCSAVVFLILGYLSTQSKICYLQDILSTSSSIALVICYHHIASGQVPGLHIYKSRVGTYHKVLRDEQKGGNSIIYRCIISWEWRYCIPWATWVTKSTIAGT